MYAGVESFGHRIPVARSYMTDFIRSIVFLSIVVEFQFLFFCIHHFSAVLG